MSSSQHPGK